MTLTLARMAWSVHDSQNFEKVQLHSTLSNENFHIYIL
jgi:hypothetical protein